MHRTSRPRPWLNQGRDQELCEVNLGWHLSTHVAYDLGLIMSESRTEF